MGKNINIVFFIFAELSLVAKEQIKLMLLGGDFGGDFSYLFFNSLGLIGLIERIRRHFY